MTPREVRSSGRRAVCQIMACTVRRNTGPCNRGGHAKLLVDAHALDAPRFAGPGVGDRRGGLGWGWREHEQLAGAAFTRQRLGFLETENRRLGDLLDARQRAEELANTTAQRTAIEHEVTTLRELPFLRRVTYREIPRSQLPAILSQKLAQQVPDKEFGSAAVGLSALGLLPPGIDLKKTYLGLLGRTNRGVLRSAQPRTFYFQRPVAEQFPKPRDPRA